MAWAVLVVILIGFVSGDLKVHYMASQTPEGVHSKVELLTGWPEGGLQLKAGLASEGLSFEASWAVLEPKAPIPVRFEIDGLKGELRVKKGQMIHKGRVIAVKDLELLKRLEGELPTLEPELKQEAQEKMEELLIRAVVEGVVQEIVIEAVEGETLRLLLDVKPPIYRGK